MTSLSTAQEGQLTDLASRVRDHFDHIEQDVPDQSFVVGGAVRDALLGLDPEDLDFVVVGETVDTMEARGFEPIEASSFPVFHDDEHEEWALARTEQKDGEGYTGFEVFTDDVSLQSDLERRDLTCNSLVVGHRSSFEANGELIDVTTNPVVDMALHADHERTMNLFEIDDGWFLGDVSSGVADIGNGVLRHVSDAFADDPLRVLRTARYAGRFAVPTTGDTSEFDQNFEVADETMDMMRQVAPELNRMSRDRIGDEITKALEQARRPSRIFEVLRDCGALAVLWPELDRGTQVRAGPKRHHAEGSVFDHTLMSLDRMDRLCRKRDIDGHDRVRRLFAILGHDIGKVILYDRKT